MSGASSAPTIDPSERLTAVSPERLEGWISRFAARHGELTAVATTSTVLLSAIDGAEATLEVPFPPLADAVDPIRTVLEHVLVDRRIGAVLVRRGGHAVGVFNGHSLVTSKVGSSYVQGTTKAGGWSQHRYARRRANQTEQAYEDATEVVARLLLPQVAELVAVVGGGDKAGVQAVLAHPRLAPLKPLVQPRVLATPDPRLRVLEAFGDQVRAVRIRLNALA